MEPPNNPNGSIFVGVPFFGSFGDLGIQDIHVTCFNASMGFPKMGVPFSLGSPYT